MVTIRSDSIVILVLLAVSCLALVANGEDKTIKVKKVKGKKVCTQGWECSWWSEYCCNQTISDYFQVYQFEQLFSKRNTPIAHAVGFWDYQSFITAAAIYEPLGFGTTGGKLMGQKEMAAFLGHVASKTSCEFSFKLSKLFDFVYFDLLSNSPIIDHSKLNHFGKGGIIRKNECLKANLHSFFHHTKI